MKVKYISGNPKKREEYKKIFSELAPEIELEFIDLDLPEIQELDAKKVIEAKLLEAHKQDPEGNLFTEDVSLYVDGLKGLPGPLIKWFLKAVENKGLADMAIKSGNQNAKSTSLIGFVNSHGEMSYFEGVNNGKIVIPRGTNGFLKGWDPIFEQSGLGKTNSELTFEEKNSTSQRRKAAEKFIAYLKTLA